MRSLATVLMVGLLVACATATEESPRPQTNVLLITVDTLRLDRVSSYGGPTGNTPNIDALATAGVRFESVQAPRGLTWPSLTTLLTGLHPRSHGVRRNGEELEAEVITIPEVLVQHGYDTGAFLANMCDAPNRGFTTFFCAWWEKEGRPTSRKRRQWLSHDQPQWDAAITRKAISFVQGADRPFFAWVHYVDPHKPFDPVTAHLRDDHDGSFVADDETLDRHTLEQIPLTAAEREQFLTIYDSQVTGVDERIGRLLAALDEAGLADTTLVVFSADHGEELGDHQNYFYHLSSVYQQVLSVPWIMRLPGRLDAGRVVSDPVASVDIAPTLMELLQRSSPVSMEGVSRLALARGEPGASGAAYTFAEWMDQVVVVGAGSWRYIWNPGEIHTYGLPFRKEKGPGFVLAAEELYDLRSDPLQQQNVVDDFSDKAAELRQQACAFIKEKDFRRRARVIRDEVNERLRSLGYVQDDDDTEPGTAIVSFCPDSP